MTLSYFSILSINEDLFETESKQLPFNRTMKTFFVFLIYQLYPKLYK